MCWLTVLAVEVTMTEDFYVFAIAALLPLIVCLLVFQVNPYHALVIRGILGAVAALVYALFGAADVALTEALVGTMLSITLYAVAVRSSMSMRMGVLAGVFEDEPAASRAALKRPVPHAATPNAIAEHITANLEQAYPSDQLLATLRRMLSKHHMRLELVTYTNVEALQTALLEKEVHTTCVVLEPGSTRDTAYAAHAEAQPPFIIQTRIQRLYDIMQAELPPTAAGLTYFKPADAQLAQMNSAGVGLPDSVEAQS
jgi:uncharacterized MnhB-related membrane protein